MTVRITSHRLIVPSKQATRVSTQAPRSDELVVLIHGLNGNMQTWADVAPKLADTLLMPVLIFDQAGHGRNADLFTSSNDDDEQVFALLSPARLALDLKDLLVSLRLWSMRLHLFGQSFGAKTALAFVERFERRVASLALGDIGICPCPRRSREAARLLAAAAFDRHRAVDEEEFLDEESAKEHILRSALGVGGGDAIERKYCFDEATKKFRLLVRPHVGYVHEYEARRTDFREAWHGFDGGPTLVLRAGEAETCIGDDEFGLMKELRGRRARDVFFCAPPDASHGVHRSHPSLWVDVVARFVLSAVTIPARPVRAPLLMGSGSSSSSTMSSGGDIDDDDEYCCLFDGSSRTMSWRSSRSNSG